MEKKGDPIPWVVQVEGKESWWIGIVVGVETRFWVVECGEWTTKRAKPPCGLIAPARGWLVVERNGTTNPMVGRNILRMQPVGYSTNKSILPPKNSPWHPMKFKFSVYCFSF
jgi:hypothetical protein